LCNVFWYIAASTDGCDVPDLHSPVMFSSLPFSSLQFYTIDCSSYHRLTGQKGGNWTSSTSLRKKKASDLSGCPVAAIISPQILPHAGLHWGGRGGHRPGSAFHAEVGKVGRKGAAFSGSPVRTLRVSCGQRSCLLESPSRLRAEMLFRGPV